MPTRARGKVADGQRARRAVAARSCNRSTPTSRCATRLTRRSQQAIIGRRHLCARRGDSRLDERQLSQALGVSRTPIREAMTLLEQEGFLRTVPRRGIFIVRKTKKQIIEMIEMWAALESMAARLATTNASDAEIAGAAHDVRRVPQRRRRPSTSTSTRTPNIAFHQAIIRLSGSHLMGKTIENLFLPRPRDPPR